MIESLEKLIKQQNLQSTSEDKEEYKDYFNRRLIFDPDTLEYFNQYYELHYKCWICYDVIFNPVYCPECQHFFCNRCASNSLIKTSRKNITCNHTNQLRELTQQEKLKFEKINVTCFFKCGSKNLNLLTYPDHLIRCKTKYDARTLKSEVKTRVDSTKDKKIHLDAVSKETSIQFNKLNQMNALKIKEKDNKKKSLKSLFIWYPEKYINKEKFFDKNNKLFLEMENKNRVMEVYLSDSRELLSIKNKENEAIKKTLVIEKERFLRELKTIEDNLDDKEKLIIN